MLKAVSFHITNKCSNRCLHCSFKSGETQFNEMNTEQISKFINEFAVLTNYKGRLNIYGGEPLLRDDIFEIIDIAHSYNMEVEIATGGVVQEHVVNRFLSSGVEYIGCDLDGGTPDSHDWLRNRPGHFEYMKKLIERFVMTGSKTSVTMVVNNKNKSEILLFLEICRKLNVSNATLHLFTPSGRGTKIKELVVGPEDWLELHDTAYEWYKKNKPNFTIKWQISYKRLFDTSRKIIWDCEPEADEKFFLRCDGSVYSCPLLSSSEKSIGNVKNEALIDVLKKRKDYSFSGRNGCPGMTYHVYGDPNLNDPRKESLSIAPACPREVEIWKPDIC